MKTRLKSPELYAIGWIAPLPIERATATALLRDRHDAPQGFDQHRSDTNSYTWGQIGEHNVVIASLPAGVYGTTSAATTASNLIHSLPHIRIGLLVGIGGGIARPDEEQDIRLGDVVVSQPDGTTGGVIQYDLGKAKANGGWERKGSLDKPPSVLLHALASLQAEHEIAPSKVPDLLQAMLEANPFIQRRKSDYAYQGAENDRLFGSQHEHVGGSNCDKCDSAWEVNRERRESTEPEIHYGVIASGNILIKDAATRDSLLEDIGHQCLCVEMEAAGLMDRFPCLVIRGICDYADSHKNDRWQRYAAATAAAFAVELLEHVLFRELEATPTVIETIHSPGRQTSNLKAYDKNVNHHITLDRLLNVKDASFDSRAEEHNPTCLPNTRQELLDSIHHWIDDPNSKTVYWLNGMAGTGKSTIARTVAHSRSKRGDLGASFFFKRGEMDRDNLNKLMSTLAYQLALSMPEVAFFIKKVLDTNPAIVGKSVKEQFEKLIQGPLSEVAATPIAPASVVTVIDALDECDEEADIRLLINIFSQAKIVRSRLRVFLTSRPELPIRLGFSDVQDSYQGLVLHEIPAQIVEHDIVVFLNDEFKKIRHDFNMTVGDERKLPPDWPGRPIVQSLARMAVPLFTFAAAVCRFVGDSRRRNPRTRLQTVLDQWRRSHGSQLEQTYTPILRSQITELPKEEREEVIKDFKVIVGSIVTLANPLSVAALSRLIDILPDTADERLDALHSVLSIPLERTVPVRLLHLSFRDYLVDSENKERNEFWVDTKLAHRRLADNCLRVMRSGLRKNICSLSFPGMQRSAVNNRQLEERVPPELQYACMYWVHHQTKVDLQPNDMDDMYYFLETHFLHWLEVLSLIGRMAESIGLLEELQSIVDVEKGGQVVRFLHDAKRFVFSCRWVVDTAPLQLYTSAIVFAPKQSIVRQTFKRYLPEWISLLPRVDSEWNAVLQTLEAHTDWVSFVVFSKDGTLIASGSSDRTIKIWNVATGKEEQTLEGHTASVNSVVFSKDGTLIASGSDDNTIKIWNVATGKEEQTLEGHTASVNSVVFSKDGTLIASGSDDNTIKIWNVTTGEEEQTLEGHTASVNSVVFSKDGMFIASGSSDRTIKIWNVATGKEEQTLEGHTAAVNSVVFSKDGTLIASGSDDNTIKIWNVTTGEEEQTLEGHTAAVNSVVFSKDGTLIASGSDDNTIKIWNVATGEEEQTLKGHTDLVRSVVFSKDGMLIASGSYDRTIKIWNVATGKEEQTLEGHTASVNSVVFSKDGTLIASGSDDNTIKIWNVATGINVNSFNASPATDVLSFLDHDSILVTSSGRLSFESRDVSTTQLSQREAKLDSLEVQGEVDGGLSFGINHDRTWITAGRPDGWKVLWLPPGFRPAVSATSTEPGGSVVVIGCPSGRVVIIGFRRSSFLDGV
ncbi:G-protein beta WD-40 repeat-containing protein [Fusarium mundagurra]|uniref:G-protein beta WD-40 repeat-containing protein n=1 Tax=Fusarium mundagurra TaxID=1567541 RepID=A0A8H5YSP3_9HYPO|nr:G-protein beta WD-40 repeat-containing protein [Fusarium mundagurra]